MEAHRFMHLTNSVYGICLRRKTVNQLSAQTNLKHSRAFSSLYAIKTIDYNLIYSATWMIYIATSLSLSLVL